jgi:hypothetical protein
VYCTCPLKEVIGERGSKTQYLGIDWASQYQRTKRDEIPAREMAAVVITTAGPGQYSGQQRHPVICLPLDLLLGWLLTIRPNEGEEYFMDDEENRERLDQPGPEADEATDQQALVPTAVRQVNFHGDVITVVLVEERGRRQVYVLTVSHNFRGE